MIQIISKQLLPQTETWLTYQIANSRTRPKHDQINAIDILFSNLIEATILQDLDMLRVYAQSEIGDGTGSGNTNLVTPSSYSTLSNARDIGDPNTITDRGILNLSRTFGMSFNSLSKMQQNDASIFVWCFDNIGDGTGLIGTQTNTTADIYAFLNPRNASNQFTARLMSNTVVSKSMSDSSGLSMVQRTVSTDIELWKNGSSLGTGSSISAARPNRLMREGSSTDTDASTSSRTTVIIGSGASLAGKESDLYNVLNLYVQKIVS